MQFKLPVVKVLLNFSVSFQGELNAIYYLIGCFLFFNIHLSPLPLLYFRSVYKGFPSKNYTLLNRLNLKIEKYPRNSCIIMYLRNIGGFDTIKHAKILNLRLSCSAVIFHRWRHWDPNRERKSWFHILSLVSGKTMNSQPCASSAHHMVGGDDWKYSMNFPPVIF